MGTNFAVALSSSNDFLKIGRNIPSIPIIGYLLNFYLNNPTTDSVYKVWNISFKKILNDYCSFF